MKASSNIIIVLIIVGCFFQDVAIAQDLQVFRRKSLVIINIGSQMSGIKDEDFIKQNVAPMVDLSVGHHFTPELLLRIGYRGPYFRTISDINKRYYNFFYGQAMFDVRGLLSNFLATQVWSPCINAGAGYFYNLFYHRPNIAVVIGVMNNFKILDNIHINFDFSAICAWDIYQNNEDILPSASIGLSYRFGVKKKSIVIN